MSNKDLKKLRKDTIKKLKGVKDNLGYDTEENYCNMINTAIDYDNEAQDRLYLCDKVYNTINVVDDETITYYLENNDGLQRLFYATRGLEYADDLYQVDAYGNLENIEKDDFECCIDDLIYELEEALKEE